MKTKIGRDNNVDSFIIEFDNNPNLSFKDIEYQIIESELTTISVTGSNALLESNLAICNKIASSFVHFNTIIHYTPSTKDGKLQHDVLHNFNTVIFHLIPTSDQVLSLSNINQLFYLERNLTKNIIIYCKFTTEADLNYFKHKLNQFSSIVYLIPDLSVSKDIIIKSIDMLVNGDFKSTVLLNYSVHNNSILV